MNSSFIEDQTQYTPSANLLRNLKSIACGPFFLLNEKAKMPNLKICWWHCNAHIDNTTNAVSTWRREKIAMWKKSDLETESMSLIIHFFQSTLLNSGKHFY